MTDLTDKLTSSANSGAREIALWESTPRMEENSALPVTTNVSVKRRSHIINVVIDSSADFNDSLDGIHSNSENCIVENEYNLFKIE